MLFFSFWLPWQPELWLEFNLLNNFGRVSPKEHPCQVSSWLAQWFRRRRCLKKLWTTHDGRRTTDAGHWAITKAHHEHFVLRWAKKDWLNGVFAASNSISVITRWQLTLFMCLRVSTVKGEGDLKCFAQGHSHDSNSGLRVKHFSTASPQQTDGYTYISRTTDIDQDQTVRKNQLVFLIS